MSTQQIVRLYPSDAETASIHTWSATAAQATGITALTGLSKETVALIALNGYELGLGMCRALTSLYVVNGRVSMSAELMRDRAHSAGYRIDIVEEDAEHCAVEIYHREEPEYRHGEAFTLDDAKAAGLVKPNSNWTKWPKAMLRARVSANAVRWFAPQVLAGCVERSEAEDLPEALYEPRVLSAEEVQDAEQRGQNLVGKHTTLDLDTVDEINAEMMQIIVDANLDGPAKAKLAKAYQDWKLSTFGVKDMGQIPASGEAELRRWVRRLGEKLGVREKAAGGAESDEELEETPTPSEAVADAPDDAEDMQNGDFEDEVPAEEPEPEPEAEDSGSGYNTEEWSAEKVDVNEFARYLNVRYDLEDYDKLFHAAGVNKDRIGLLNAAERWQVYEYVTSETPEQGDLFAGE